jgi:DNA-directed RNA polymerase II subunit RPB2
MDENISWTLIDKYFKHDPKVLVSHHIKSYNDFFNNKLQLLLNEKNPIVLIKKQDEVITFDKMKYFDNVRNPDGMKIPVTFDELKNKLTNKPIEFIEKLWGSSSSKAGEDLVKKNSRIEYKYRAELYMGGIDGNKIYYGKPIISDDNRGDHVMYPNEARLRNMTYAFTLHMDVEVKFKIFLPDDKIIGTHKIHEETITLPKIYFGRFPIMLQSDLCVLNNLSHEVRFNMGECRNDYGGYFIIDGKEKVIHSQEKFADNVLYIQVDENENYSFSAKIRSASEDASKPIRTFAVRMIAAQPSRNNGQIVVSIPNVRAPIPLFILMRALGVISDKDIITSCLLNIKQNEHLLEYFRAAIHDAGLIFTQAAALKYIATFVKGKSISHTMQILMVYLLPHIGELNFKQKALYIGYVVKRLLLVVNGSEKPTNRDSYKYKRLEVSGMLLYQLFREYYDLQQRNIHLMIDKEYFYMTKKNPDNYKDLKFITLINDNVSDIFKNKIVEDGFKKAFKGNWGSQAHTKRIGVVQDLSRLSYWSFLAQLRKSNVPITGDGAKIIGPRLLNSTQWGNFCPVHTPDGGNIGMHKHMALMATITSGTSGYPFIKFLRRGVGIKLLEECSTDYLANSTKIFVNGAWIGSTDNTIRCVDYLKLCRRNSLINIYTSIAWDIYRNEVQIFTDSGRICHPILYVNGNNISYERSDVMKKIQNDTLTWDECIHGFADKKLPLTNSSISVFELKELYNINSKTPVDVEDFLNKNASIIDYVDTNEMDGLMLPRTTELKENYAKKRITHTEIHPSVILSIMANQTIFTENNQYPRGLFSCGQSKQAVSLYSTNFQNRMDKTALVLNCGQIPLIKSRYLDYITHEEHPYGVNAIVAIACYSGYNVEDAVIFNRGSLDRGIFRTTYLSVYESEEDVKTSGNAEVRSEFMDVNSRNVVGLKPGYDYSHLDPDSGLIKENVPVTEKTIIIGKASNSLTEPGKYIDESSSPKTGQLGYIDKSFMVENENGKRISKVRIRHDRTPMIGDKFCSRAGQKGTIGIVLDEKDMPFNSEGIRPDIIVNPHAFPSRMTIGHLVEALFSKVCCLYGSYGDCTSFTNKGTKDKILGDMLTKVGYSSTGNEFLYNGMTGEQLETEIFFGPTYYLRLKHMVKDKINARGRGPRTALTRQTVGGRANGGGLRVGEMDRDAIIAHGMTNFIKDSMMERGDKFKIAICNKSGTIAIYNEEQNLFMSLFTDGPVKFARNKDNEMNIIPLTKYGRDFSIIEIPYSFKLLYHELQAMNIQMRIITEDNIDQMTSLRNSNNIELLTGLKSFKQVIAHTMDKLREKDKQNDLPDAEIITPPQDDRDEFDIYPEMSPAAMSPGVDEWMPEPQQDRPFSTLRATELPDIILRENMDIFFNTPEIGNSVLQAKIIQIEKEGELKSWDITVLAKETGELLNITPINIFVYVQEDNINPPLNAWDKQSYWFEIQQYIQKTRTISPQSGPVSPNYAPISPNYAPMSPSSASSPLTLDVVELPTEQSGFRSFNVEDEKRSSSPVISEDPFDIDKVYEPGQYKGEKVDLDNSPSDDINYERRGGKERVSKELENKEGLDALLVKTDLDNKDEKSDDGIRKNITVKID